jgi:esterase/lipase superfamily enzyme
MLKILMLPLALLALSIVNLSAPASAQETPAFRKGEMFQVAGVAPDDVLNMRAGPSATSEVIASLSPKAFSILATGVKRKVSGALWARVSYHGVEGWVNTRFLKAQYSLPLDAAALFALGLSVSYRDYAGAPAGFTRTDKQHPNRCPFEIPDDAYVLSISNEMLRHFESRGFSLNTLCMALTAPMHMDLETGNVVPYVEMLEGLHEHVIILNVPDCFKNGTPLLDCRIRYHWYWGRQSHEDPRRIENEYIGIGRELDNLIRGGISSGQFKERMLSDQELSDLWESSKVFIYELGMTIRFCEINRKYPRGYACALDTQTVRGDETLTGDGQVPIWTDDGGVACAKASTCTPTTIFFGTIRKLDPLPIKVSFSEKRATKLTLGRAVVTVPKAKRKKGELPRPSWKDLLSFKNPFREDPSRHFTIAPGGIILYGDEAAFLKSVSTFVKDRKNFKDHAIVFVHGFNITFENALYRLAQLSYDLGENDEPFGSAFLFSWPSAGQIKEYLYDSDSARSELAVEGLVSFLRLVAERSGVKHVHVLAHSMGNVPTLQALDRLAKAGIKNRLAQIVFAAPDVDKTDFETVAQRILPTGKGFTLYASSKDVALIAARKIRRDVPRAGDITLNGPVIVQGIDTIDVSGLSTDVFSLNHSEYADKGELIADIGKLLRDGTRPPRGSSLVLRRVVAGIYWAWDACAGVAAGAKAGAC